jgi:hypothetical protein
LIRLLIAILCFLAGKIAAEYDYAKARGEASIAEGST